MGYPVVEVSPDGTFLVSKPPGTDGMVSFGSVAEQLLYEIGDPGAYLVPDVACDFTQVKIEEALRCWISKQWGEKNKGKGQN
eukprot:g33660.t1